MAAFTAMLLTLELGLPKWKTLEGRPMFGSWKLETA